MASLLAADLPDPGSPTVILLVGALGGFLRSLAARMDDADLERRREVTENGVFYGIALGLAVYFVGLATGVY